MLRVQCFYCPVRSSLIVGAANWMLRAPRLKGLVAVATHIFRAHHYFELRVRFGHVQMFKNGPKGFQFFRSTRPLDVNFPLGLGLRFGGEGSTTN